MRWSIPHFFPKSTFAGFLIHNKSEVKMVQVNVGSSSYSVFSTKVESINPLDQLPSKKIGSDVRGLFKQ